MTYELVWDPEKSLFTEYLCHYGRNSDYYFQLTRGVVFGGIYFALRVMPVNLN